MKKLFALLLACVLLCSLVPASHVMADDHITDMEDIPTGEVTTESDFADDSIMVVLSNEASLSMEDYDALDFAEIGCSSVTDLTSTTTALVRAELTGADTASVLNIEPGTTVSDDFYDVEPDAFEKVLCLKLKEPGKENVLAAIKALSKREDVVYAGPDYILTLYATTPSDSNYRSQWALDKIQLPQAWDISTGSSSIIVGVLDTGIDGAHPELSARVNVSKSQDFTSGSCVGVTSVTDPNGHGTHVAGIIAAQGNNVTGISGVAWDIRLASLRVFNSSGLGMSSVVALAIDFAKSAGIPILNFSAGWNETSNNYPYYDYALEAVIKSYSGLFICAAGNNGISNDKFDTFPANYRLSNLISVGASSQADARASVSNYGKTNVDIFAPGDDILSCYPVKMCELGMHDTEYSIHFSNGYHIMDGTSMAAPHVAGVAALILSKHRGLDAKTLKQWIMSGVDTVYDSSGNNVFANLCVSGGRLNALKATNNHLYTYSSNNASTHTAVCRCGRTISQTHSWVVISEKSVCSKCGYQSPVLINSLVSED